MTPDPERPPAWIARLLVLVLLAGAALRIAGYVANPSFSVDEAMLTLGVASRSFTGLLRPPLPYDQIAPPLFLWASKAATLIGGVREPVLRMLPVLSGLALPYSVWAVARRLLSPGWALFPAACAALAPILVQYSLIFKPYITDAFLSIVLIGLVLDVLGAPERAAPWARLALGGVLAIICSVPAVFVVSGSGVALAASPGVRRASGGPARLAGLAVLWGGAFAGVYLALLRNPAASGYMQDFWAARFLTPATLLHPARAAGILGRFTSQALSADRPLDWVPPVTWLAALAGGYVVIRREGARGIALVAPIVTMFGASAVHRYPIAPRVCLFAAPQLIILYAAFADALWRRWSARRVRWIVVGLAGMGLATLAGSDRTVFRNPPPPTRLLANALARARQPGDAVYALDGAVPAWTVYTTDWRSPDTTRLGEILRSQSVAGTAFHNARGRGRAVSDTEGARLVVRDSMGPEVIGLAPGMQWRDGTGFSQSRPDPGWASREGARIREAAGGSGAAWLVLAHIYPDQVPELLLALTAQGGSAQVVWQMGAGGGAGELVRVLFTNDRRP